MEYITGGTVFSEIDGWLASFWIVNLTSLFTSMLHQNSVSGYLGVKSLVCTQFHTRVIVVDNNTIVD